MQNLRINLTRVSLISVLLVAGCAANINQYDVGRRVVIVAAPVEGQAFNSLAEFRIMRGRQIATTGTVAELTTFRVQAQQTLDALKVLANATRAVAAALDAAESAQAGQLDLGAILSTARAAAIALRLSAQLIGWEPPGLIALLSTLGVK